MTVSQHAPAREPSTAELLHRLSDDSRRLIRDEIELAQREMKSKARRVGRGAGLLSAAGLLALGGFGAAIATAVIALALVVDPWLSALIVTGSLFLLAGLLGLVGRQQTKQGLSLVPEQTAENLKRDIDEVKGAAHERS